jgi:secondary thiamine-phosphate synthase enzyme
MSKEIQVDTQGQGLYEFTSSVEAVVKEYELSSGVCTVFVRHTSASLCIQENADPSARYDLEKWLQRLVPENDPHFTHTLEGPDDMPAHIKAAITASSLSIPIYKSRLGLGTWQGIYLWEHRDAPQTRKVLISVLRD